MPNRERITPEQIQALKQRLDLREIAAQFTELHGRREKYGPCPNCRGTDRFHCTQRLWFCRVCRPPTAGAGRADVLDLLIFLRLAHDFREAYEVASSWAGATLSPVRQRQDLSESGPTYESPEWQQRAQQEVERCQTVLLSEHGTLGQAYLRQRGFTASAWQVARLGLTPRLDSEGHKGWAISIPWWHGNNVTAIQYRFIQPQTQQRYTRYQYAGCYGETILFALPPQDRSTLIVCEGEFNALSVWQVMSSEFDVVSIGSQNMTVKTLSALKSQADAYQHIKVWTDEQETAAAIIEALGRGDRIVADGGDANELLQQGRLQHVLRA